MANVTVVEDGLVEMRKKVFQLMRGTEFTAVVFNEVSTRIASSSVHVHKQRCLMI